MNVGRLSDLGIEPFTYSWMIPGSNVNVYLGDNIVWITGKAPKGTDLSLILAIPKHTISPWCYNNLWRNG